MKIKDIKPAYLQKLVYKWHDKYKQYDYIRKMASQVFKYGVSLELIDSNPMAKTLLPRKKDEQTSLKFWTKEQLIKFLQATKEYGNPKFIAFFRLLAYTGMRKGEALALNWGDIDLFKHKVHIHKTIAMDEFNKHYLENTPKTRNSIRTITIDIETVKTLMKWKNEQRERFLYRGINTNKPEQLVFSSERILKDGSINSILSPSLANGWMNSIIMQYNAKQTKEEDKLPKITIHNLRHTHVSILLEAGVPIKEVSERVGHKDSKITLEIYAHVSEKQEEKSAEIFANYMAL